MHSTIREEERQKKQAMLEKRALDSVLKSNSDADRPKSFRKKQVSGRIVHTKKSAIFIDILSKEKIWIYKRKP